MMFLNSSRRETPKKVIKKKSIWLITNAYFFRLWFFMPSVVLLDFLIVLLGVSLQGDFKNAIKKITEIFP
jgi:hypothetical protein